MRRQLTFSGSEQQSQLEPVIESAFINWKTVLSVLMEHDVTTSGS
jgi:hypothetical protein